MEAPRKFLTRGEQGTGRPNYAIDYPINRLKTSLSLSQPRAVWCKPLLSLLRLHCVVLHSGPLSPCPRGDSAERWVGLMGFGSICKCDYTPYDREWHMGHWHLRTERTPQPSPSFCLGMWEPRAGRWRKWGRHGIFKGFHSQPAKTLSPHFLQGWDTQSNIHPAT